MTRPHDEASHPAPMRDRVTRHEALFAVAGGPLAWFVQVCAGFAASSQPCFRAGESIVAHARGIGLPLAVGIACLLIAIASVLLSWRLLTRTRNETAGDHQHLLETGRGRTRFMALWGLDLGIVFAGIIALNLVLQVGLQPCAR
ncbi:hypothetical protein [Novosphingobium tardum]